MKKFKKRAPFTHITEKQRDRIQSLWRKHTDQVSIAEVLGIDPSTVCREIHRLTSRTWSYSATDAQKDAESKREHSKRKGMYIDAHSVLRRRIVKELKNHQSPDAIAGRLKRERLKERVGSTAIYTWLYSSPHGQKYTHLLCTKRTKQKTQSHTGKRSLIPNKKHLTERPKTKGLVHTERDLFVSPTRLHSKPVGLLVVTLKTKLFVGHIVSSKSTGPVMEAVERVHSRQRVDTSTTDNGIESIQHETLSVPTYFCDPHAPWQKPNVEGGIGLIRRWYLTKGTNLKGISDELYQSQLHVVNYPALTRRGFRAAAHACLSQTASLFDLHRPRLGF
jgi:transposase, IS30 family